MRNVYLNSIGHFHPPHRIENSFFDELDIGSDAAWVVDRVGIQARHSVLSKQQILDLRHGRVTDVELRNDPAVLKIADLGGEAWKMAEERHGTSLRPDVVICGTSVPDFDIPANASTIAARIGAEVTSFDCNSACSSFITNLHVARSMVLAGTGSRIAVFNPERYSLRLNYSDRASCVLFGDGCSAALLSPESRGFELLDTQIESLPSKFDLIQIPIGGCFSQNGHAVQKFAITRTLETTQSILQRNGLKAQDCRFFIAHQANLRMITSAAEKLGFAESQHLYNVDQFGNQGAAGAPSVLSQNWDKFRTGDILVIAVVGSGLTWGAALLRKV